MQLTLFRVLSIFSILSICTAPCFTKGGRESKDATRKQEASSSHTHDSDTSSQAHHASGIFEKLKSSNPLKFLSKNRSKGRRSRDQESPEEIVCDNKRLYELQAQTLLSYFDKENVDYYELRRNLDFVSDKRATFNAEEEKHFACAKAFVEKYCVLKAKATATDQLDQDEKYTAKKRCRLTCTGKWGYVLVPDKSYKYDDEIGILVRGQLIPIATGDLLLEPKKKKWLKRHQPPEDSLICECNVNNEFLTVLDEYGIDSQEFATLKSQSYVKAWAFLLNKFENTGLKMISPGEFFRNVADIMKRWDLTLSAAHLNQRQQDQRLKEFRGESDNEADEDYWKDMVFYRKRKSPGSSPTSAEYLQDYLEKIGNLPERPRSPSW